LTNSIVSPSGFQIKNWTPNIKNNFLTGFFSVVLPGGLVIHSLALHERDGRRRITMPAKPVSENGRTVWVSTIDFSGPEARNAFQDAILEALDRYFAAGSQEGVRP
jgi:hypothetical protein